jgi:DNA polymerase III subunit delta'
MAVAEATEHQPRARAALSAALAFGPAHAYLFRGPRGSGKRAAARSFAAEILADTAEDPEDVRRRALLDPSPHPDLVWLAPAGAQHMVEEVRERVIRAAAYRPFEGGKRVFVIEAAEAMRDESQNALLKTLEEPPAFVHLILLSSEPTALLETIASRCQPVDFAPLPPQAVEAVLREDAGPDAGPDEIAAAAHLAAGDVELGGFLLSEEGRKLRADSIAMDWKALLADAEAAGEEAEAATRAKLEDEKEAGMKRSARDIADAAKRAGRRRRTELLDLGLALAAGWCRDLAATAAGAADLAHNRDRLDDLRARATGLDPPAARKAAELVQDTRRRLDLNVSEELALEALSFRLAAVLG